MSRATIYLAGGLFTAGERLHNLMLEKKLVELGYDVILPQREAKRFFDGKVFDLDGVMMDCLRQAGSENVLLVGNLDGPDADSGTAVEITVAIVKNSRAVVYRTDFRTNTEHEFGVNAMLRLPGSKFIYEPCTFTELAEVDTYYRRLAEQISDSISLVSSGSYREKLGPQENA